MVNLGVLGVFGIVVFSSVYLWARSQEARVKRISASTDAQRPADNLNLTEMRR